MLHQEVLVGVFHAHNEHTEESLNRIGVNIATAPLKLTVTDVTMAGKVLVQALVPIVTLIALLSFIPEQAKAQDERFSVKLEREGEIYAACMGCGSWIYFYKGDWYAILEEENGPVVTSFPVSRISSNVVYAWKTYFCEVGDLARKTDALGIPRGRRIKANCTSAGWVLLSL
jgi:hypothetical protein